MIHYFYDGKMFSSFFMVIDSFGDRTIPVIYGIVLTDYSFQ